MFVKLRKAVSITGLCAWTLRKYADNGTIPSIRTPSNQRLFDVEKFSAKKSATICYARVSTPKQRADLKRQSEWLVEQRPGEIITDIGSGLNFKRKGLQAILERAMRGECLTVVVAYRDRLARFGFDLIEWTITRSGGQVVVLNSIASSPESELIADLMAVITVFAARLHGLRNYKDRIKSDLASSDSRTTGDTETVDGGV
jgi:predicted site-specific integrase-resolvase